MIRFNLYGYGFKKINFKSVDDYISRFPEDIRKILEELRSVIRKSAPKAEEKISYQIPAFVFHGNLVYFAAYKNILGFIRLRVGSRRFKTN